MKNIRFSSRRHFIWMASISTLASVFSGFNKKTSAEPQINRVPGNIQPKLIHLPQNTQLILREIKLANPNDPTALSRNTSISPQEIEAAFDKLNNAFSFNQRSGQLTRNPAIQLNSDEEQIVQQLLKGYHRQIEGGEIKLRRGANRLFIPLTAEKEEYHHGVIPQRFLQEQIKSLEKSSKPQSLELSVLAPEVSPELNGTQTDNSLIAAGCGWQWWRSYYWWGIRISLNKTAVNWLTSGAAGVSAILGAMGIGGLAAAAISALAGIIKAISNQNGIRIYVTWIGALWATPKPTSSGGC